MKDLIKYLRVGIAVLLTVCTVSLSIFAHAETIHKPGLYKTGADFHFVAVVPYPFVLPEPKVSAYTYPVNDGKPVNKNYQLVKHEALGLIHAQINY